MNIQNTLNIFRFPCEEFSQLRSWVDAVPERLAHKDFLAVAMVIKQDIAPRHHEKAQTMYSITGSSETQTIQTTTAKVVHFVMMVANIDKNQECAEEMCEVLGEHIVRIANEINGVFTVSARSISCDFPDFTDVVNSFTYEESIQNIIINSVELVNEKLTNSSHLNGLYLERTFDAATELNESVVNQGLLDFDETEEEVTTRLFDVMDLRKEIVEEY